MGRALVVVKLAGADGRSATCAREPLDDVGCAADENRARRIDRDGVTDGVGRRAAGSFGSAVDGLAIQEFAEVELRRVDGAASGHDGGWSVAQVAEAALPKFPGPP